MVVLEIALAVVLLVALAVIALELGSAGGWRK
jgi:hypothetical protein